MKGNEKEDTTPKQQQRYATKRKNQRRTERKTKIQRAM